MPPNLSADDLFVVEHPDELRALARQVFTQLFRAGEAYSMGGAEGDVNALGHDLDARLVVSAMHPQGVAVYRLKDGRAVIVSGEDGLWAVDVLPHDAQSDLAGADPLMDAQDYEEIQIASETATLGDGAPWPVAEGHQGPEEEARLEDEGRVREAGRWTPLSEDTEPPTEPPPAKELAPRGRARRARRRGRPKPTPARDDAGLVDATSHRAGGKPLPSREEQEERGGESG